MVATACLVTAILVPILTAVWVRRHHGRDAPREEFAAATPAAPLNEQRDAPV
jgi:2-keto-3-deoxygluconate permease